MNADSYYKIDPIPVWTYKPVLISLAVTLLIFLVLPLSDLLVSRAENREVRALELAEIKAAKPKKTPPQEPEHADSPAKRFVTTPQLANVKRPLSPLLIPTSLALDLASDFGDFSLNFALTPTTLGDQLVFELSEVDSIPEPIVQVPPLYPYSAKARGIEGRVELLFVVQPDGSVSDVQIKSSFPRGIFDEAAMNAVKKWRFKPGTRSGKPVATRALLPLKFEIER